MAFALLLLFLNSRVTPVFGAPNSALLSTPIARLSSVRGRGDVNEVWSRAVSSEETSEVLDIGSRQVSLSSGCFTPPVVVRPPGAPGRASAGRRRSFRTQNGTEIVGNCAKTNSATSTPRRGPIFGLGNRSAKPQQRCNHLTLVEFIS